MERGFPELTIARHLVLSFSVLSRGHRPVISGGLARRYTRDSPSVNFLNRGMIRSLIGRDDLSRFKVFFFFSRSGEEGLEPLPPH